MITFFLIPYLFLLRLHSGASDALIMGSVQTATRPELPARSDYTE